MFKGSIQNRRTETSCNIPWDNTTTRLTDTCVLETKWFEVSQRNQQMWASESARKGAVMNKSKCEGLFPFYLLSSSFWKWKRLYLVLYTAWRALMTAALRKPSELEVGNNDYRTEDVTQKVKQWNLWGSHLWVKCHHLCSNWGIFSLAPK